MSSHLLLQGWVLTADTCPMDKCYTPLMRSRTGVIYCPKCDITYEVTRQGNSVAYKVISGTLPASMQAAVAAAALRDEPASNAATPQSTVPAEQAAAGNPAARLATTDATTAALTKAHASSKVDEELEELGDIVEDENDDDDDDDWQPPSAEEQARIDAMRRESDRCSAEIAQYMLQRWVLLNERCLNEDCVCPLLARPDGRRFCVGCHRVLKLNDQGALEYDSEGMPAVATTVSSTSTSEVSSPSMSPQNAKTSAAVSPVISTARESLGPHGLNAPGLLQSAPPSPVMRPTLAAVQERPTQELGVAVTAHPVRRNTRFDGLSRGDLAEALAGAAAIASQGASPPVKPRRSSSVNVPATPFPSPVPSRAPSPGGFRLRRTSSIGRSVEWADADALETFIASPKPGSGDSPAVPAVVPPLSLPANAGHMSSAPRQRTSSVASVDSLPPNMAAAPGMPSHSQQMHGEGSNLTDFVLSRLTAKIYAVTDALTTSASVTECRELTLLLSELVQTSRLLDPSVI